MAVEQIWQMVQGQNRTGYEQLIQGWQQAADATERNIDYLEDYRSRLAASWPPSASPAAQACHDQLEAMIANMRVTWSTALSNRSTLETVAGALDSAYTAIARIYADYMRNQANLARYEQSILPPGQQQALTPESLAARGRQAVLEAEARAVMSALSTDLAVGKSMIRTPDEYRLTWQNDSESADAGGDGAAAGAFAGGSSALSLFTLRDQQAATRVARDAMPLVQDRPVTATPVTVTPVLGDTGTGPTLVGTHPTNTGPGTSPATTPGQTGLPAHHNTVNPVQNLPGPNRMPTTNWGDPAGRPSTTVRSPSAMKPMGGETLGAPSGRGQQATHPNLLGGSGTGTGRPMGGHPGGHAGGMTRGVQRVNAVGGVIGETAAPGRPNPGLPGTPGGRGRRDGEPADRTAGRSWDPDNPWETDDGVTPVLDTAPRTTINPGPAIGLT
ncbi:hypothetical protein GCM10025331_73180 [Actinoplanes utahensis]|uniref:PPE family domain-containing protein n=2 Tax=Actinoplanes utahensis TaxID=1869 RepID=A0A0A6UHS7_ACTUT|nr:hypothetical protein MB27_25675 [Actinoplanes utahensis]GIF34884.1 hypothetical protein Aut01nite_78700 [Actinoplanes utahensis]